MDYFRFNEEGRIIERVKDLEKDVFEISAGDMVKRLEFSRISIEDVITVSTPSTDESNADIADIFRVRGDVEAKELFEFFSDNLGIEFTRVAVGEEGDLGLNFISTTHAVATEVSFGILFDNQLKFGYNIREHYHNHPSGSLKLSDADVNMVKAIDNILPNNNIEYYLYVKTGNYGKYNRTTKAHTPL